MDEAGQIAGFRMLRECQRQGHSVIHGVLKLRLLDPETEVVGPRGPSTLGNQCWAIKALRIFLDRPCHSARF